MIRFVALNESDSKLRVDDAQAGSEVKIEQAYELYQLALKLEQNKNYESARNVYTTLLESRLFETTDQTVDLKQDKSHPRMYLKFLLLKNLGQLIEKEGNLSRAMELFSEAASIDGKNVAIWFRLGQLAFKCDQLKLARYAFEQCLLLNPHDSYAVRNLAEILYCLGDEENCLSLIETYGDSARSWKEILCLKYHLLKNIKDLEKKKMYGFFELREALSDLNGNVVLDPHFMDRLISKRSIYMNRGEKIKIEDLRPVFELHLGKATWEALANVIYDAYEQFNESELEEATLIRIVIDEHAKPSQGSCLRKLNESLHVDNDMPNDDKMKLQHTSEVLDRELKRKKSTTTESGGMRVSRRVKEKQEEEKAKLGEQPDFKQVLDPLIPGGALHRIESVEQYRGGNFENSFSRILEGHIIKHSLGTKRSKINLNPDLIHFFESSRSEKLKIMALQSLNDKSVEEFLNHVKSNGGIRDISYRFLRHVCLQNNIWPSLSFSCAILNILLCFMVHKGSFEGLETNFFLEMDSEKFSVVLSWAEIVLDYVTMDKKYHLRWFDPIDLDRLLEVRTTLREMCTRAFGTLVLGDSIEKRLLWFFARMELFDDNIDKSSDILHNLLSSLEASDTPSIILPHCIEDAAIDIVNLKAKLLEIQNEQYIYDAKNLFHDGKFAEVIERLRPVLSQLNLVCRNASPWRSYELQTLFVDSLVQLHLMEEAFGSLCDVLTFLMQNLLCTDWMRFYEALVCVLEKLSSLITHRLISSLKEGEKFDRLLADVLMVIQMTQILMEHDDIDLQTTYSLPWIVLFDILRCLNEMPTKTSEEYNPCTDNLHEFLGCAHHELGKRFRCTADDGRLLKICIEVFSAMTDEDSISERNQCYYCLYGLNLDPSVIYEDHQSSKHPFDQLAINEAFRLVIRGAGPRINASQPLRGDIKWVLEELIRQCPLPPQSEKFSKNSQLLESIAADIDLYPFTCLNRQVLQQKLSGFIVDNIDESNIHSNLYFIAAYYHMMQLPEIKARESGRWDKRIQTMDRAIELFQIDIALNPHRKESWLHLGSCLWGKTEAILNTGPHFFQSESETAVRAMSYATRSFYMANLLNCCDTWQYIENYGILLYSIITAPMKTFNFNRKPLETSLNNQEISETLQSHFSEAIPLYSDKWMTYYFLGKVEERNRGSPEVYMGLYRTAYENSLKDGETDEPLYRLLSSALKLYMRGFSKEFLYNYFPERSKEDDFLHYVISTLNELRTRQKWHHKAIYRLAYIYYHIEKDALKTRQELSNLFHLKSSSGKLWNVWRLDWELPGKFFIYCHRYARFLLQLLSNDKDYDILYYVMKKLCKTSNSEVSGQDKLAEEAFSACLELCHLELPSSTDFLQQFPYWNIEHLSMKLYQVIITATTTTTTTSMNSPEKFKDQDFPEKLEITSHLETQVPYYLCWIRRLHDLQREKDLMRPHLEKLKEWMARWFYELTVYLFNSIETSLPSEEHSSVTQLSDIQQEAVRLLNMLETQKRSLKPNQPILTTTTTNIISNLSQIQTQPSSLDGHSLQLMSHDEPNTSIIINTDIDEVVPQQRQKQQQQCSFSLGRESADETSPLEDNSQEEEEEEDSTSAEQ